VLGISKDPEGDLVEAIEEFRAEVERKMAEELQKQKAKQ
jgi:hypothetical protein